MKVVISRCYGGFGISIEAQKDLINMGCEHIIKGAANIDEYFGKHIETLDDKLKYDTPRQHMKFCEIYIDIDKRLVYHPDSISRECLHLIKLIKDKGSEYVSGQNANLQIVEIPDDICYEIDQYDGFESIEECHRSW